MFQPYDAAFAPIPILQVQVALSTANTVRTTWIEEEVWAAAARRLKQNDAKSTRRRSCFCKVLYQKLRTEDDVINPFGNESKYIYIRSVGFITLPQAKEPHEQIWLWQKPQGRATYNNRHATASADTWSNQINMHHGFYFFEPLKKDLFCKKNCVSMLPFRFILSTAGDGSFFTCLEFSRDERDILLHQEYVMLRCLSKKYPVTTCVLWVLADLTFSFKL